ncbi:MAG: hypothetical protein EAZ85_12585 [Bacteroidetes bacterium]|nr:MAG: hypothetical protein EAZ85_12585 [Bacteroidota bacterium]TAG95891.1 MAG: hypothetical protein EAZ20_00015 [Bacteroidota bacterium]
MYPKIILFLLISILINQKMLAQKAQKKVYIDDLKRVGCICKDGEEQDNIGVGACSGHGGVMYWLYVEEPIYGIYERNLPAIPNNQLVRITPGELADLVKRGMELVLPHIPKIPDNDKENRRKKQKKDDKNQDEEQESQDAEQQPKKSKNKNDCDCANTISTLWIYFIIAISQILIFVLMYLVIKKTLKNS